MLEKVPPTFKCDLKESTEFLNSILEKPKSLKTNFIFATDKSIDTLLLLIYYIINNKIPSKGYLDIFKTQKKSKYVEKRFSKKYFATLIKESRRKKIKTLQYMRVLLPGFLNVIKKKSQNVD